MTPASFFFPLMLITGHGADVDLRNLAHPPARYDHPFAGLIEIREMPRIALDAYCNAPVNGLTGGCTRPDLSQTGVCVMAIAEPEPPLITEEGRVAIFYHERAHCNGWPANHPED